MKRRLGQADAKYILLVAVLFLAAVALVIWIARHA